ncbi:hypothetical protein, variant [Cryptococcus neoformans var. grubii H99]|uniref:Uncharacterized protein n=1 Tax=Cryptococcus neoformans (strain H99 / ATCC 208821 / CBS 10515 / FGSC 9487) TaxID=235443 RepID=T2BMC0_CRYN9|nr:hypothetical protein, variant [Cryptococcus neoformans var. grubii H99]AGV14309.1 hypothetical protein, variant [Cryptococcus neoformans var. grubii H99]AUB24487.1 hypothetical protein CKF44_01368 [Cryptococcus neoformans var. grubii]|eukprot:XP_012049499.1 hypothetical protein, variant [Cryptococcus neoformans var. grubii H99]
MMTATATTATAGNGSPVVSRPSSPATPARSAYVPPSAPQIVEPVSQPVRKTIESFEEAGPFLERMVKELDDLPGFTDFRSLNPLKQQHFRNSSALVHALGEHLPRAFCDISELRNKEEWMLSILRTSLNIMITQNNTLFNMASEMEDLRSQVRDLEEKMRTGNGGLENDRARKKLRAETDHDVLNLVHGVVREMVGMPRKGPKPLYVADNWPDYNEEEAPDGFFLKDGRIFWRPNWSNLRCAFFENLVSTAVKKCLQDDQFFQIKSKPTNNELRGRVVDYLNSVVREKKKAEVKKKTEARMKNVKGRTMRFRVWLISNWKDTPLDGCKERDLLKRALLSERGVLRNLHFLEHNETEDVLKRVAERRSNSAGDNENEDDDDAYDEFLLLADAYYGSKVEKPGWVAIEPWWWSPVVNPPCCLDWIRKLVTSPRQGKTQVNSRFPPTL